MILLDIGFRTDVDKRAEFLAIMEEMVARSRAEAGCLTYRLTAAIDDPLSFHLLELWKDEPSYLAHRDGPTLTRLRAPLAQCSAVFRYERSRGAMTPYTPPEGQ